MAGDAGFEDVVEVGCGAEVVVVVVVADDCCGSKFEAEEDDVDDEEVGFPVCVALLIKRQISVPLYIVVISVQMYSCFFPHLFSLQRFRDSRVSQEKKEKKEKLKTMKRCNTQNQTTTKTFW